MSAEANKALVTRYLEALGTQKWEELGKVLHKDYAFYTQVDTPFYGVEGFLDAEEKAFAAFTDLNVYPMYLIAEDDKVAALVMFEFSHTSGPYFGMRPQGKKGRVSIGMFFEIKDGLILTKRAHYDKADFWKQMGATELDKYIESL